MPDLKAATDSLIKSADQQADVAAEVAKDMAEYKEHIEQMKGSFEEVGRAEDTLRQAYKEDIKANEDGRTEPLKAVESIDKLFGDDILDVPDVHDNGFRSLAQLDDTETKRSVADNSSSLNAQGGKGLETQDETLQVVGMPSLVDSSSSTPSSKGRASAAQLNATRVSPPNHHSHHHSWRKGHDWNERTYAAIQKDRNRRLILDAPLTRAHHRSIDRLSGHSRKHKYHTFAHRQHHRHPRASMQILEKSLRHPRLNHTASSKTHQSARF
jgi:hypothetical protein